MRKTTLYEALGSGALQEKTFLLFWTCGHCGEKAGFYDGHCSSCGSPFDSQELGSISDEDFLVVVDEGLKYKLTQMIGWYCSHCDSYNRNLKRSDYESGAYKQPDFHLSCEKHCGNQLDEVDGDYILRDGPSASNKVDAVRNLIRHNQKIRARIHAKRVGRIVSNDFPATKSRRVAQVGKSHRSKALGALEKKHPNWYYAVGGSVGLLSAFLLYKGFENFETTITIEGLDWKRSLYIESVQTVNKTGWMEDVDGSAHQTNPFHNYQKNSSYYENTGREDINHNPQYCKLVPDSEDIITGYSCRDVTSESCTGTSGGGVTCRPVTNSVCDVPVWGTRDFSREQCQKVKYTIHDWEFDRRITAPEIGKEQHEPYWPNFSPKGNGIDLGSEREVESNRTQTYTINVTYKDGENQDSLNIPREIWDTLYAGLSCPAEADFINGVDTETIDWKNCGNIMELGVNTPYFEIIKKLISQ